MAIAIIPLRGISRIACHVCNFFSKKRFKNLVKQKICVNFVTEKLIMTNCPLLTLFVLRGRKVMIKVDKNGETIQR